MCVHACVRVCVLVCVCVCVEGDGERREVGAQVGEAAIFQRK